MLIVEAAVAGVGLPSTLAGQRQYTDSDDKHSYTPDVNGRKSSESSSSKKVLHC